MSHVPLDELLTMLSDEYDELSTICYAMQVCVCVFCVVSDMWHKHILNAAVKNTQKLHRIINKIFAFLLKIKIISHAAQSISLSLSRTHKQNILK